MGDTVHMTGQTRGGNASSRWYTESGWTDGCGRTGFESFISFYQRFGGLLRRAKKAH